LRTFLGEFIFFFEINFTIRLTVLLFMDINLQQRRNGVIMDIKYYCQNSQCKTAQKKTYVLKLNLDDVMDEKNIAQMYCPYCKTELKKERPTTD